MARYSGAEVLGPRHAYVIFLFDLQYINYLSTSYYFLLSAISSLIAIVYHGDRPFETPVKTLTV
jgi:hypothetical protein